MSECLEHFFGDNLMVLPAHRPVNTRSERDRSGDGWASYSLSGAQGLFFRPPCRDALRLCLNVEHHDFQLCQCVLQLHKKYEKIVDLQFYGPRSETRQNDRLFFNLSCHKTSGGFEDMFKSQIGHSSSTSLMAATNPDTKSGNVCRRCPQSFFVLANSVSHSSELYDRATSWRKLAANGWINW